MAYICLRIRFRFAKLGRDSLKQADWGFKKAAPTAGTTSVGGDIQLE
jgi:hypothetical protein